MWEQRNKTGQEMLRISLSRSVVRLGCFVWVPKLKWPRLTVVDWLMLYGHAWICCCMWVTAGSGAVCFWKGWHHLGSWSHKFFAEACRGWISIVHHSLLFVAEIHTFMEVIRLVYIRVIGLPYACCAVGGFLCRENKVLVSDAGWGSEGRKGKLYQKKVCSYLNQSQVF